MLSEPREISPPPVWSLSQSDSHRLVCQRSVETWQTGISGKHHSTLLVSYGRHNWPPKINKKGTYLKEGYSHLKHIQKGTLSYTQFQFCSRSLDVQSYRHHHHNNNLLIPQVVKGQECYYHTAQSATAAWEDRNPREEVQNKERWSSRSGHGAIDNETTSSPVLDSKCLPAITFLYKQLSC